MTPTRAQAVGGLIREIDPLVRQYHGNVVRFYTGTNPQGARDLDLPDSRLYLTRIWARCLEWSNQRPTRIYQSILQLNAFLENFQSSHEIHDLISFQQRLESHVAQQGLATAKGYGAKDAVEKIIEGFTGFYSVQVKTASLIMRFLLLDSTFFGEPSGALNPPLDRVNFRMLERLGVQGDLVQKSVYGPKDQRTFAEIGTRVLGEEERGLIDNLWFIGHFYCDDNEKCSFREVFRLLEPVILKDLSFMAQCPFERLSCRK